MMPDLVCSAPAPNILLLQINRPDKRNALATPILEAIAAALGEAGSDEAVRTVIITGSDKIFAAGADLDELAAASSADELEGPRFRAWAVIGAFPKPLIAAVEGWCLGAGLELLMRCDLAIAGESARFGQPETNLGIIPGAGGTAILPRLVGRALAMEMVLTGEPISAERARSAGLISTIVANGDALDAAVELGGKLAARAPQALRAAKASLLKAGEVPLQAHLLEERAAFVSLLSGAEKQEGIAAFRDRRTPTWS